MKNFPIESTPENRHLTTVDGSHHDVYKLIEGSKGVLPIKLEVSDWEEQLGSECWSDPRGNRIAPQWIINSFRAFGSWEQVEEANPEWKDHIKQIKEADLSFPLLINKHDIIDGMHRLVRAVVDGVSDIYVKVATPSESTQYTFEK